MTGGDWDHIFHDPAHFLWLSWYPKYLYGGHGYHSDQIIPMIIIKAYLPNFVIVFRRAVL